MGWGVYRNEPAVRPAGPPPGGVGQIFGRNPRWRSRPAGPSPGGSAGQVGRPTLPLAPSFSAEPHRRQASPPFHSDELYVHLIQPQQSKPTLCCLVKATDCIPPIPMGASMLAQTDLFLARKLTQTSSCSTLVCFHLCLQPTVIKHGRFKCFGTYTCPCTPPQPSMRAMCFNLFHG